MDAIVRIAQQMRERRGERREEARGQREERGAGGERRGGRRAGSRVVEEWREEVGR